MSCARCVYLARGAVARLKAAQVGGWVGKLVGECGGCPLCRVLAGLLLSRSGGCEATRKGSLVAWLMDGNNKWSLFPQVNSSKRQMRGEPSRTSRSAEREWEDADVS